MSDDHADFYIGTGPHARWLGSLAEFGSPVELAGPCAARQDGRCACGYHGGRGALLGEQYGDGPPRTWTAEAGHTTDTDAVLKALCAADRDNRAADQALSDAAGDFEAMSEVICNQISFIEVYVLRVLAVLGLAVPVPDGSWWAHLASQTNPLSR